MAERGERKGVESLDVDATGPESWLASAARAPIVETRELLAAALPPGAALCSGRFTIRRRLGLGGMGVVYEATDHARGNAVAIKTFTRNDAAAVYRLKLEFRALADVSHPNLVRLHELFTDDRGLYFSMELVDGEPFDSWVRPSGTLDEARLRSALPQLASAIFAIHAAGKVHRDLKPSNVLVGPACRVVVLDFGLSSDAEPGGVGQTVTETGVMGTPAYMAPEQAAGKPATQASDWYALGVMLFEALSGKLPFEGRAGEILAAKQTRDAPPVTAIAPACPQDLAKLCGRLLACEPAERPALTELRTELGIAVLDESGVRARSHETSANAPALIGRDRELEALAEAHRASIEGERPVIVLVSGESGIGKSALCQEFLHRLEKAGSSLVLSGRCYERESVPFNAFDAVLDDVSRHLRKLESPSAAALVPREAWALCRLFPVLGRVSAFAEAPAREVSDARELQRRGFFALGELFGRLRDRQSVIVWIDDLHWGDADSIALLMHLVRQPDAPRLLLLLSFRSGSETEGAAMRSLLETLPIDVHVDCRGLELGPLSESAAAALVRERTQGRAGHLVSAARGNPFLLLELDRYLAHDAAVPASLDDVLRARIEQLPAPAKRFLEVISLAARPLPMAIAAEAAGLRGEVHDVIETLRAARLVTWTATTDHVHCYHDSFREAAQRGIQPAARKCLHRALVAALESREDVDVEQLALHMEEAGDVERAGAVLVRAAEKAESALAFERSAHLYRRALDIGGFEPAAEHRLRLSLADALSQAGRRLEAAEIYLESLGRAGPAETLEIQRKAAFELLFSGHFERGSALLDEALRPLGIRVPRTTVGTLAAIAVERARLRFSGLEFRERQGRDDEAWKRFDVLETCGIALGQTAGLPAIPLQTKALLFALRTGDPIMFMRALTSELWCSSVLGAPAQRLQELSSRVEAQLARTNDADTRCMLHHTRGFMHFWSPTPDYGAALHEFDRFLALHRERPSRQSSYRAPFVAFLRINSRINQGFLGEGARAIPALLDDTWSRGNLCAVPMLVGWNMALARLAAGDVEQLGRDQRKVREQWPRPRHFGWQEMMLCIGEYFLGHYAGRPVAWPRVEDDHSRFTRSTVRRAPIAAMVMHTVRGQAALVWALRASDRAERTAFLRIAERSVTAAKRYDFYPSTFSATALGAALAYQRGDIDGAIRSLAPARGPLPHAMPFYAHAARLRLGGLLGGDEGRALLNDARAALREAGVVDPARFVTTLLPGYPDH